MLCVKLGSQRTRLCICARKANSVPYASVSSDFLVLSLSLLWAVAAAWSLALAAGGPALGADQWAEGKKGATNYSLNILAIVVAKHIANRVASYDFTSSH